MANQINEQSKKSYKEGGSTNAVKLLSKVDNFNGYIRIYTELDSNFKVGDTVYISSEFTVGYTGFTLDNFIENNLDDYPYVDYANGYKIRYVKNNEIVIDRPYKFDSEPVLNDHYISKISFNTGSFNKGELNSVLFKYVGMSPSSGMSDIIFNQAIVLSGSVSETMILDKYDYHYISQNGSIDVDNSNKITYSFNNKYGYSYFNNVIFLKCSFNNGYYNDCRITTLGSEIANSPYAIKNGYYDTCTVSNHAIDGGYLKDCDIDSVCTWNNGSWESDSASDFGPSIWNDGVWIKGDFIRKTWNDGDFKSGIFSGSTWYNGVFNGVATDYYVALGGKVKKGGSNEGLSDSSFIESNWFDGVFNGGQMYETQWVKGTFNNGYISNSTWSGGTFNNGKLKNTTWKTGTFNNGDFGIDDTSNTSYWYKGQFNNGNFKGIWYNGYFKNGLMKESEWYTGIFTDGDFYKSTWYEGIWYDGTFNQSIWTTGTWYNGTIEDIDIESGGKNVTSSVWYNGDWINGEAKNGTFHNINWSGGTATNVIMGLEDTTVNWYDGSFSGSKFGYAQKLRQNNSISMTFIAGGSISPSNPRRYFVIGEYVDGDAYLNYEKLLTWLGHNGEDGVVVYTDRSAICINISIEYVAPDTMTFYGETYVAIYSNFDVNFSSIYSGFTGNWYGGSLYGGSFFGNWYDGNYYNSSWYGKNIKSSDYYKPPTYAGVKSTSSSYQNFKEDFIQKNVNLPPETNPFNPQNPSFQDPTYFD